ncbi:MAG: serine hydroxymethyltransferase [Candidatus Yanofskybacteria bacterium CG10_big_fil_rev_8_21_14_0_10_36_16]|uniref:Probable serine hydroxymethyltransferase n=1 Tax=Candidatus Yanofskybacteria bacterium CG10_big_fil_rev_8_21_14_0_10_36_16 TaxID=1975096 RepID=A0A2J0Q6R9_9BACT|nr:MAG: serine hydroxymethyltransferase [Candidatus Yanofskybacteria bacterium CG10_big_fil_rev_8_21_14_0_10_36_16]
MSIKQLIKKEESRQKKVINLIASENYASKNVLEALGSSLVNKYAEGYPGKRYYFGNKIVDEIESQTKELATKVFGLSSQMWNVNVQPYSGSSANLAAYLGSVGPGSKILAMSLEHGGHLTHGHQVSWTGKLFNFKHYGVDRNGLIDYEEVSKIAKDFNPDIIVCGATAYPRILDFEKFGEIAKSVNSLLMADISHIAGLIAGEVHPSPFPHADIITSTTQKTLRGPRGAFIIAKKELMENIDKSVFPGLQGGPHLHTIAAMGVMFEEALKPSFKKYAKQIVKNAKTLADELQNLGLKVITGGTDNHLMLVDVTFLGLTGKQAGELLESKNIIVNKNMIPFDPRKPWDPSGIRLGTSAVTSQGMTEKDMVKIAQKIYTILTKK